MEKVKKTYLIAGARPNFMKIAPLYKKMKTMPKKFNPLFIHTGQHYDNNMSDAFLNDLGLPEPDIALGVGSSSHAQQTAKIMMAFENIVINDKPDLIVVVGDVNSTIACALVASKLGIPVAHIEAGLRSSDRTMPEEINRILTDQLSDYLFTSCEDGNTNLIHEGVDQSKIHFVGNIMIESLIECITKIDASSILKQNRLTPEKYALLTLHRPSNVDELSTFKGIIEAIREIAQWIPIIFPAHPRTLNRMKEFGLYQNMKENGLIMTEPLRYFDFLALQKHARFVLTDSGGVQEETTFFHVPCLTLRQNTERPITISDGTNQLIGTRKEDIIQQCMKIMNRSESKGIIPKFWDNCVAKRIVEFLVH